jgi:hypothetical protein
VGKEKGKMENIVGGGGGHCIVWLTSLGAICCNGWLDSWSIFLLDSRNMGQYFEQWLVSLPWNMQYGCLNVYGPQSGSRPRFGAPPL